MSRAVEIRARRWRSACCCLFNIHGASFPARRRLMGATSQCDASQCDAPTGRQHETRLFSTLSEAFGGLTFHVAVRHQSLMYTCTVCSTAAAPPCPAVPPALLCPALPCSARRCARRYARRPLHRVVACPTESRPPTPHPAAPAAARADQRHAELRHGAEAKPRRSDLGGGRPARLRAQCGDGAGRRAHSRVQQRCDAGDEPIGLRLGFRFWLYPEYTPTLQ